MPDLLEELVWKSLLLAGATLLLLAALWRRSSAEKSLVAEAGILGLLLLPVTIWLLPHVRLAPPQQVEMALGRLAAPGATGQSGAPVELVETTSPFPWEMLVQSIYAVMVLMLLGALLLSLLGLRRISRRARVVEDPVWLTALASAQARFGMKHGTALLRSDEIGSPISWGVVRPVIVIDPSAWAAPHRAEAIIAHELAHVHRLDWLALLGSRLAAALFWFNPLVWLLVRRCHELREEAADDAVLRTKVSRADYAQLLVTAFRKAGGMSHLAASGVAPSRSSTARRVAHVLATGKSRAPAGTAAASAAFILTVASSAALAVAEPVRASAMAVRAGAGEQAAAELAAIGSPHTATIARAIAQRDWSARRIDGITTFHEPAAVPPLILALGDDHPEVRRIALWALSEMRPRPEAVASASVAALLADPVAEVRAEAVSLIGEVGGVGMSRSIEKLLVRDPSAVVRLRAAHALGDMQQPASRHALEQAALDPDPSVQAKAAWALRRVAEAERNLGR